MQTQICKPMGVGAVMKIDDSEFQYKCPILLVGETDRVMVVQDEKIVGEVWGGDPLVHKAVLNKKWIKKLKKGLFSKTVNCSVYYIRMGEAIVKHDDLIKLDSGYNVWFRIAAKFAIYISDTDKWFDHHVLNGKNADYFAFVSCQDFIKGQMKKAIAAVGPKFYKESHTGSPRKIHLTPEIRSSDKIDPTDRDFLRAVEKYMREQLEKQGLYLNIYLQDME